MQDSREIIFKRLFTAHYGPLCRFAYRFVGNLDTARELVQDAFIILWERGAFNRSTDSLRAFLYTVVKNHCLNYIQQSQIHRRYRQKILLDYARESMNQEDALVEKELQKRIEELIAQLPAQCRKVFMMNRYYHFTYKEIAQVLGISQKAVEAHISKALQRLREALSDYMLPVLLLLGLN